jgi:hypothetical protein
VEVFLHVLSLQHVAAVEVFLHVLSLQHAPHAALAMVIAIGNGEW